MGKYYNNYSKDSFKEVATEKLQPERYTMARAVMNQGKPHLNPGMIQPIYTPVTFHQPQNEFIGKMYDFAVNNPNDLESILYHYFTPNPNMLSKEILYINDSEIIVPTEERVNREIEILSQYGINYNPFQAKAHIMSNSIENLSIKSYNTSTEFQYSMDYYIFGILYVYILNKSLASNLLSQTPEGIKESGDIIFNNIHDDRTQMVFLTMSICRDYYLFPDGSPIVLVFQGTRSMRTMSHLGFDKTLAAYNSRKYFRDYYKKAIKDGIHKNKYNLWWLEDPRC